MRTVAEPAKQRRCSCGGVNGHGGKCAACRARELAARSRSASVSPSGGGRPLEAATRATLERRFGHDFGRIRVHDDERAARSADALGTRAYALGSQIVFGRGAYAPGTATGRRVLAHEIAHTIQQRDGASGGSSYTAALEGEATAAGELIDDAAAPLRVSRSVASVHVQRFEVAPPPALPAGVTAEVLEGRLIAKFVANAERTAWRIFWEKVAARFALRAAASATVAFIDGPMPFGDLIALGMTLWMIYDLIEAWDEIWEAVEVQQRAELEAQPEPEPQPEPEAKTKPVVGPQPQTTPGKGSMTQTKTVTKEKREEREPCDEVLPITWPAGDLPTPEDSARTLYRTPGGYLEWLGIGRGAAQRRMAEHNATNRQALVPPENPCFDDEAEPNAPYDAHHVHPLYLNGEEAEWNLCSVETGRHMRGHRRLDFQWMHAEEYAKCGLPPSLRYHPFGQEYEIVDEM